MSAIRQCRCFGQTDPSYTCSSKKAPVDCVCSNFMCLTGGFLVHIYQEKTQSRIPLTIYASYYKRNLYPLDDLTCSYNIGRTLKYFGVTLSTFELQN